MNTLQKENIVCPSARCEDGAILLGIVTEDGNIAFARKKVMINEELVQITREGRPAEKRLRFSNKCVE